MKKVLLLLIVLAVAAAAYVVISTPGRSVPVTLGSDPGHLRMIQYAPPDAPTVYFVPRAAGFYRAMKSHSIATAWLPTIDRRPSIKALPLLLGGADVVAWQEKRRLMLIADPDPIRRVVARVWLAFASNNEVGLSDGLLFIGTPVRSPSAVQWEVSAPVPGQAFAIHRRGSENDFPPIGRPAVSSLRLEEGGVKVESRSAGTGTGLPTIPMDSYPAGAMLASVAASTPEWLERLGRLVPPAATSLLRQGALFAVYKVDGEKLIPRLYAVIAVPGGASKDVDEVLSRVNLGPFGMSESKRIYKGVEITRRSGLGSMMDYATSGGNLVVAFDRSSIERYLSDRLVPSPFPKERTVWFATMKPRELAGGVEDLEERQELSLLAPDLHEAIKQAAGWLGYVEAASRVEMARMVENGGETFIVNVSK